MQLCASCGTRLRSGERFCTACGTPADSGPEKEILDLSGLGEDGFEELSELGEAEFESVAGSTFCRRCGTLYPDHPNFCRECGIPLRAPSARGPHDRKPLK